MERTDSSYNFLYLKHRLTHQLVFRRTQMCAVKDQFVLIPLAGKLDKAGAGGGFPDFFPGCSGCFHLALLEEMPFTIQVPGTPCVESQPHSSSHVQPEAFCLWGLHQGLVKWGSSSSGSPFGQTTVHPPRRGGENGVYRVYRPLSGNCPMLLDMQKVRFNITGNLVLLLMLTHLTKIQVGMPSSFLFQRVLTYLPLVMLTDPTS